MFASEKARNWLKFIGAVGISLFFTWLFVRGVDIGKVRDAFAQANYVYLAPAMSLFSLSVICRAFRWSCLLRPAHELSWRQLMPSVLIGYAGNNLLPMRAGELVRAQYLSDRFGVARMQTVGVLLMERLFDALVLGGIILWGLLLIDGGAAYVGITVLLAIGTVVGFVFCVMLARNPELPERIAALPIPLLTPRLRREIAGLGASLLGGFSVLTSFSRTWQATLWSAGAWGLELTMYWLISQAFDLHASFIVVAFAGCAANVSLSLPSAQGGIGPFEVFATQALMRFNVGESEAGAYALALHFFLIVPVSLVGLVVLWRTTWAGTRVKAAAASASVLEADRPT